MMMTPTQMTDQLVSTYGFTLCTHADQVADLGLSRDWLTYLKRIHKTQHQYLWLTTYENRFLEALLQVYAKPFNSRAKPAQPHLHIGIHRTMEAIVEAAERTYAVAPKS